MENFIYQNPTKIIFGQGQISELKNEISKDKKILLIYGGGSIKKNGVYDQVKSALKNYDITEFSGIEPNPHFETCMKAVDLIRNHKINYLLAVGGGSVIDATKFIAAAVNFKGDEWDILAKWAPIENAIPFGTVLTLPATGSEMNSGSVISKSATHEKLFFINPAVFPQFSILDPETTFTLPPKQTGNGIVDTFVHTTEQYLTYPVDSPLQDRFAEGILHTLIEEAPKVLKNPQEYNARSNIMWASTLGLNGLIGCGVPQDWATHMIGHAITAVCGLDHGQTLAIVLPSLLTVRREPKHEKLLQYASRIWNLNSGSEEDRITKAIDKTREFFEIVGIKTKLADYGIGKDKIAKIIEKVAEQNPNPFGEKQDITIDVVKIILENC